MFILTFFKKRKFLLMVLIASLMIGSGCARVRRKIAYTIYPVGWMIQRIGGNHYDSVSIQAGSTLLQNGKIRDDYKDVLSSSKVLFHLGSCEPYMRVYAEEINDSGVQEEDLSILNAVYDFARYTQKEENGTVVWQETPYYEGSIFQDIDHDKKDLYIWLDPVSMLAMAGDIKNWMKNDNPAASSEFEDNYTLLKQDLIELDAEYQELADQMNEQKKNISFAAVSVSFGCWQKAYGISVYPIMLSKYGALPDEDQLQAVEERIQKDDVKLIVHETNLNSAEEFVYQRVKNDCELQEISLSNLSALSEEESESGKDYLSLMYDNLQVLRQAAALS